MKRFLGDLQGAHTGLERLSAYLDNQVSGAERAQLEAHLHQCALCQGDLESLRQTVTWLHMLPRVPVPRAFTLSEVQAGIRRPATRAWWQGSLLWGLGTVTAVILLALGATVLLRQPSWAPGETLARVVPTDTAPAAPAAAIAVQEVAPTVQELAPTEQPASPAPEPMLAMEAPAETEAATQEPDALAQKAAPPAEPPTPEAAALVLESTAAPAREMSEAVVPSVAPGAAAPEGLAGFGDGGAGGFGGEPGLGAGGAGIAAVSDAALTPSPAPALVALDAVLPSQAGIAYADWQSLSVVDAASGERRLAQIEGTHLPVISGDRAWVAYRVQAQDFAEVRLTAWDGAEQKVLLTEGDLANEPFDPGYGERRIQSMHWAPGRSVLAVVTAVFPTEAGLPARQELWHVAVPEGDRKRVLEMDPSGRVFYAPDGARLAVLDYGTTTGGSEGSLALYDSDTGEGETVMRFSVASGAPTFPSQIHWLPDGRVLLLAVPEPDGLRLYRVDADGDGEALGLIPANETFWSPDGSRLAYLQPSGDSPEARDLILAAADGANAAPYATLRNGQFLGWSPDGTQFLYLSNNDVYRGGPDRSPERLDNFISLYDPRWIAPNQIIALLDQGTSWMLVWRNLDTGEAGSLMPLPKDISYDFVGP